MDVAGALGEGALDQGVDKADGGGGGLRVGGVPGHLGGDDVLAGTGLALHLLDDAGGALAAIQALDGLLHRLAGGDHGDDAFAGGGLDLVLGHKVQGVVHGQVQAVLHQLYRDHEKLFGQVPGDVFGQLHGNGHGGQVHEVHAQLHTQRVNELRFGDNPCRMRTSPRRWPSSRGRARACSSCSPVMIPEETKRSPSRIYATEYTSKR